MDVTALSEPPHHDRILDVTDVSCPLPLLKTKMALKSMAIAEVLWVQAADAGSWRDIPKYVGLSEHQLVDAREVAGGYHYWIRKGGAS